MNAWLFNLYLKAMRERDVTTTAHLPLCTGINGKCRKPAPFRVSFDLRSESVRDHDWIEPVECDHCEECLALLMKYAKGNPQISDLRVNDREPEEALD